VAQLLYLSAGITRKRAIPAANSTSRGGVTGALYEVELLSRLQ